MSWTVRCHATFEAAHHLVDYAGGPEPAHDIPIWVDAAVMKPESIVLGGGDRSTKLRMTPATLAKLPGVEVVQDLAR